jgi:hypothetical protein
LQEIIMSTWRPNPAAEALHRPPRLPSRALLLEDGPLDRGLPRSRCGRAAVTLRVFDGSEGGDCRLERRLQLLPSRSTIISFPPRWTTPRHLASSPHFLRDGLALAFRDGRCVGFCRNE